MSNPCHIVVHEDYGIEEIFEKPLMERVIQSQVSAISSAIPDIVRMCSSTSEPEAEGEDQLIWVNVAIPDSEANTQIPK